MTARKFSTRLLKWYDTYGRHDLPWQQPRSFYRVWIAEIMLQQTQVATVLPYYEQFMQRFADLPALAAAPLDEVLAHWSGLGYYARARNLHRAAQVLVNEHGGVFPQTLEAWQALPGIGRSTAAAILAQVCGQRHAILDGNVRRVLARHAGIDGWPGEPRVAARLWLQAESLLPLVRMADYTQALMDLGATLCTARAPRCTECPLAPDCVALRENRSAVLPTPRPRRTRPQRRSTVLLIEGTQGRWLLERRPPAGIWGGLWCPPLYAADEDWRERCGRGHGMTLHEIAKLEPVDHAFTHFDLHLQPVHALLQSQPQVLDAQSRWFTMKQLLAEQPGTLGLPAPIRRLFAQLKQDRTACPEPYTASSSIPTPKASTDRPIRARSVSASSTTSASEPGRAGSPTRRA